MFCICRIVLSSNAWLFDNTWYYTFGFVIVCRKKGGKGGGSEEVNKAWNKYAKYTTVGDGKALWKAAAEELAAYAVQV